MTTLDLRPARDEDVAWIVEQEQREEFAAFIQRWPAETHKANLADPDCRYLTAEQGEAGPCGYVILKGLGTAARSIELARMVAAEPGRGLGKAMLREVIRQAFGEIGANRLWLDVFDDNERARRAYRAAGFVEEGILREAALRSDGRTGSLVIMSILASEQEAKK